jgi:hypothetical protein
MSWLRAGRRPLDLTLPASAPLAIFAPSAYAYLVEVTKHVVFQGSNEDFEGDTQLNRQASILGLSGPQCRPHSSDICVTHGRSSLH